jgi:hypothetical protein
MDLHPRISASVRCPTSRSPTFEPGWSTSTPPTASRCPGPRTYGATPPPGLKAFDLICPERASKNIGDFCVLLPGQVPGPRRSLDLSDRAGAPDRDFDLTETAVREWMRQAERDAGTGDGGLTSAERRELAALRRENRQLREDLGVLKRATAFFVKETR